MCFSLAQEEETPLHCAAWHGYYSVAKALCEAGCNVNIKNREGETPLLTASARGYHDIVECLAEHGADLNACDKVLYWGSMSQSQRYDLGDSWDCETHWCVSAAQQALEYNL